MPVQGLTIQVSRSAVEKYRREHPHPRNLSAMTTKASCTIEKAMFYRRHIKAVETEFATLRTELATLKVDVAEMKRTLSRLLGENHSLREENDRLRVFAAPAVPVRRHTYPNCAATDET